MRLIRLKIRKDTRNLLNDFAKEQGLDADYMTDLYSLLALKGAGIPTEERLKRMCKHAAKKLGVSEVTTSILARKRVAMLKSALGNGMFRALSTRKDLVSALRSLIIALVSFERKNRQAQCKTCSLFAKCAFGQQYGNDVFDVSKVLDADYTKNVHPDCPVLPDIDKNNRLATAFDSLSKMYAPQNKAELKTSRANNAPSNIPSAGLDTADKAAQEMQAEADHAPAPAGDDDEENLDADEAVNYDPPAMLAGAGFGRSSGTPSFHGGMFATPDSLIQSVSASQLLIFELGRKFSQVLTATKKGKYAPVSHIAARNTNKQIDSISDVTKLESAQHGLPEEVFDAKLTKKELNKVQPENPKDKKQLLYFLIDASGSMRGWLGQHAQKGLLTRCALSSVICHATSKRVEADKGYVFSRFFAGAVTRLFPCRNAAEFEEFRWHLANCPFNGGGTDIIRAVKYAMEDIAAAEGELAKAEILLITDCEDQFDENTLRSVLKPHIDLNILDVSGAAFSNQGVSGALKRCSQKYYKANETVVDVNKLVDLI